jgi:uncharacterized protein (DUF488 family)
LIVWTIGHSTRTIGDFIGLLEAHDVRQLIDVRRFPASRRHPQFNRETLPASLANAHIDYVHLETLGGRRPPRKDSPNSAWRVAGFRGYADYMETKPFQEGLERLMSIAASRPAAIMCAEASWRSCHRSLISDALKASGWEVVHIVDARRTEPHPYTPVARIVDGRLTYAPAAQQSDLDLR